MYMYQSTAISVVHSQCSLVCSMVHSSRYSFYDLSTKKKLYQFLSGSKHYTKRKKSVNTSLHNKDYSQLVVACGETRFESTLQIYTVFNCVHFPLHSRCTGYILCHIQAHHMCFDRFLLAFESRDLSQADKSIIRVSSFPSLVIRGRTFFLSPSN